MTDSEREKKLIQQAAHGDRKAFESLITDCSGKSYGLALKMLKNQQDAEDAVQDAFLKAWRGIPAFKGNSRFDSWLYRIVYNTCLDTLRGKTRRTIYSLTTQEEDGEEQTDLPDTSPGPEEQLLEREQAEHIRAELAALPEKLREPLLLRELRDCSYEEIAQKMEIPIGTVRSRISRARRTLAERLREKGTILQPERQKEGKEGDGE